MKSVFFFLISTIIILGGVQGVNAQVLDSCDQWANYCSGGYCVYNNLWGDGAGPQCITAQSTTRWTIRSTQSGGGVKTYPNSSREMGSENVTIESLSSCTSTMNVSVPGSGDFCTAWDIWCPEEVMIWMNTYGNVSPWGSYVETATIGGVTWDVYKNGYPGFVRQSNTNSMTVDIKAILDYCVSKGWLHGNGVIEKIQGGFEITSTGGTERTFTMNSYSVSYSTGPVQTPIPTATPNPTPDPTTTPSTPPSIGPGNGDGLVGEYFDDTTLSNLVLSRVDAGIDFNWGGGSPDSSLPSDQYSIRWTGRIEARMTETYTFTTRTDDGARLWIDNQLVIDDWTDHAVMDVNGTFSMQMGNQYDIRMEYYESGGDASAQLLWSNPYLTQEIIPRSQLYSGGAPTPEPTQVPTLAPTNPAGDRGDVNEDGSITIVDALLIAQYYVDLDPPNFNSAYADTNCDGSIGIVDALLTAQFYVGLINGFC
jgi:hypothetical protein